MFLGDSWPDLQTGLEELVQFWMFIRCIEAVGLVSLSCKNWFLLHAPGLKDAVFSVCVCACVCVCVCVCVCMCVYATTI